MNMIGPVHHCGRFQTPLSRRQMLTRCANGFGAIALMSMLGEKPLGTLLASVPDQTLDPLAPRPTHFPPQARNVIFLYMDGGPSQVDTFDPKPLLSQEHGQPFKPKMEPTQFNNNGTTLGCPWTFHQYGQSGIPVSDLFPYVSQCVDDLCIIRSMVSNFSEHTTANYFLHTGLGLSGRP